MTVSIKKEGEFEALDVKRLYLPFKVTAPCPICGKQCTADLSRDPALSYPTPGEPEKVYVRCTKCENNDSVVDAHFTVQVVLEVSLRAV